MAEIEYFTATGVYTALRGAQRIPVTCRLVRFTPLVTAGVPLDGSALEPPQHLSLGVVRAEIRDGILVTVDEQGNVTDGVQLPANTEALGLATPLFYRVEFVKPTAGSRANPLASYVFEAKTEEMEVDLRSVSPVPGANAIGLSKGDKGDPGTTSWDGLEDMPAVIAAGDTEAEARAAIGAVADNDSRLSNTRTPSAGSVTTGTMVDANVTLAKLAGAVQTSLGKADSAEQAANRDQPLGYPTLGSDGKLSLSVLPFLPMEYKGTWNSSTNSPTLADNTGVKGQWYRVTTGGTRNLGSGSLTFDVGDYAIHNGTVWEKVDTTDAVASVAGLTGTITASGLKTALSLAASDVGLGNVDNTSDATKNAATATLTNKTINGAAINNATALSLGTTTSTGTGTPKTLSLGGTYGTNTAGAAENLKLLLHDPGTSAQFGFGVSVDTLEYQVPMSTQAHKFFVGGSLVAAIDSSGLKSNGVAVATTTATQTLTNKTLTNPVIGGVYGSNGLPILTLSSQSSAVNYLDLSNGSTGNGVQFVASGTDANISFYLRPRGTGSVSVFSDTSGVTPRIRGAAVSPNTDTNVGLNLQTTGTGVVQANGVEVVTVSVAQTLTSKTLTTPKIAQINDPTNDRPILSVSSISGSAVNYFTMNARQTGLGPVLGAASVGGTDPNANIHIMPRGSSAVYVTGDSSQTSMTLGALSSASNVDLNLTSVGTGVVKANGVPVVTTTGAQTLTNKTLTTPVIAQLKDSNGNVMLDTSATASAVNYLRFYNKASGSWPVIECVGSDSNVGVQFAPKGTSGLQVWVTTGNTPYIEAAGADTDHNFNIKSKNAGVVQANGVPVVTTTGAQTLTNKTLTDPKISSAIYDTNGNKVLHLASAASAVNYVQVSNGSTGNQPYISAQGSDSNLSLWFGAKGTGGYRFQDGAGVGILTLAQGASATDCINIGNAVGWPTIGPAGSSSNAGVMLLTKGNGDIRVWVPTSQTPTIVGTGPDTNHDLNLTGKGTGVVKANGVQVDTISGAATLTNKTLTDPVVGSFKGSLGNRVVAFIDSASAVNYFEITNDPTGFGPVLRSKGSDTNVDVLIQTQGTGVVKVNGVQVDTVSGTATLTNKTLTSPQINSVFDTSNNGRSLQFGAAASTVNFITVKGVATGGTPTLSVLNSSDSNVGLLVETKGTGVVTVYAQTGQTPTIYGSGADSSHDLNLAAKNAGRVKENGNIINSRIAVPSTATSTGKQGQTACDGSFMYYCTSDNTWVRAAVATW